jgi:hypothetical protein
MVVLHELELVLPSAREMPAQLPPKPFTPSLLLLFVEVGAGV